MCDPNTGQLRLIVGDVLVITAKITSACGQSTAASILVQLHQWTDWATSLESGGYYWQKWCSHPVEAIYYFNLFWFIFFSFDKLPLRIRRSFPSPRIITVIGRMTLKRRSPWASILSLDCRCVQVHCGHCKSVYSSVTCTRKFCGSVS